MKTKKMTQVALMSAVICILSPLTLPIGPVPVTLGTLAVLFSAYLLGAKYGTLSYLLYYLLGCFGLPVFSGFQGGISKALGPTGGFLIGFFALCAISGFFIEKYTKNYIRFLGMLLGETVCYLIGVIWYAVVAHTTLLQAFLTACAPFIAVDILKMLIVILVGNEIKKRIVLQ
ncbi:MAG: biotin transporter BioY [Firmicutes bacterium]|nr:biotin transporter BioY [Bacillota bacterium]